MDEPRGSRLGEPSDRGKGAHVTQKRRRYSSFERQNCRKHRFSLCGSQKIPERIRADCRRMPSAVLLHGQEGLCERADGHFVEDGSIRQNHRGLWRLQPAGRLQLRHRHVVCAAAQSPRQGEACDPAASRQPLRTQRLRFAEQLSRGDCGLPVLPDHCGGGDESLFRTNCL